MAIVTRRYQFVGPSNTDLARFVSASAAVAATFQGPIVDISIDDSQPGATTALDEYMATLDFQFSPGALKPTTAVIPYAPGAPIAFGVVTFCGFGIQQPLEDVNNWPAPRPGMLQSFQIDVTANTLAAPTEFIIRTGSGIGLFGNTPLLINVPAATIGPFNFTGAIPINAGDRVSLRVTTAGLVGAISFTGSVDFA